ncbi:HEAT repeat domain-containing protein [Anatilimnocola floriformis]|uniref:HEAT repeat domain-containing protein n=1 Tax=Anatilimnocola floriformis TaxID=2948575 RepID=UPI0020C498F0|nr:HEAT repeat domain-containing protein [Anatilimnocola floriformis]
MSFGRFLLLLLTLGVVPLSGCGKQIDPEQELIADLKSTDVAPRRSAVRNMCDMRPVPAKFIPPLIAALNDNDPQVRQRAAEALGETGIAGRPFAEQLNKTSTDHFDPQVRFALERAVRKITAPQ